MSNTADIPARVEPDRVRRAPLLVSLAALLVSAALIHWGVWEFQSAALSARAGAGPIDLAGFSSKDHWLAQRDQVAGQRRQEDLILSTYGWVDRKRGIARIPIQRAIEILAAQHPGSHSEAPR